METPHDSPNVSDNILIVDDEVPNLQLLSEILSGAGYQVRPARSPHLALDSARAQPPDLILLDVRMPEMDGFELCGRLKQEDRTREIPIIFVSALQDVEDRVRGFELGGVDFISKPFQVPEVLARVGTHLELHKIKAHLEHLVVKRTAELGAKNQALQAENEERTRTEAALSESRRFIDHLVERANALIIGLDTQGTVTLANPAVERLTGYAPSELLGRDWFKLLIPEQSWRPEVRGEFVRLVSDGQAGQFENAILTRSGEERTISWSNSLLENEGQVVGTLSFGVDVTERREQEKRLQEYQERLRALASDLTLTEERERRQLAEQLHDGPVQSLAYTRMQLASATKQADAREQARVLDEVSKSLREAALAISRIVSDLSSPAMKELGLAAAISDWTDEQVKKRFGIETTVISLLQESEAHCLDDLSRTILFRNVRELLANVVKHSQATSVHVLVQRAGDNIELTVRDNGKGCDRATILGSTGSRNGFGLFSIRERMADLGGTLEIKSGQGRGFTATLIMPLEFDRQTELS